MPTDGRIGQHKEHSPERDGGCPSPGNQEPSAAKGHGTIGVGTQMGHRAEDFEAGC